MKESTYVWTRNTSDSDHDSELDGTATKSISSPQEEATSSMSRFFKFIRSGPHRMHRLGDFLVPPHLLGMSVLRWARKNQIPLVEEILTLTLLSLLCLWAYRSTQEQSVETWLNQNYPDESMWAMALEKHGYHLLRLKKEPPLPWTSLKNLNAPIVWTSQECQWVAIQFGVNHEQIQFFSINRGTPLFPKTITWKKVGSSWIDFKTFSKSLSEPKVPHHKNSPTHRDPREIGF